MLRMSVAAMLWCGALSGCGADRNTAGASEESKAEQITNAAAAASTDNGEDSAGGDGDDPLIAAEEHGGTWIFWHELEDHDDALLAGVPEIANGCLRINGEVVVWHESRLSEAQQLVEAIVSGETVGSVSVGGGEGTEEQGLASGIANKCPGSKIWFGAPAER